MHNMDDFSNVFARALSGYYLFGLQESYGKSRKYTLELVPPQQKRGTLPMPPPLTFDFYLENLELLRTTVVAQFKHSHHVLPLPRAHSSRGNESKPQGGWGAKLPSSALQRRGSTGTTGNFFRDRHRHQQLLKSGGTKFSSPFSKKDRLVRSAFDKIGAPTSCVVLLLRWPQMCMCVWPLP